MQLSFRRIDWERSSVFRIAYRTQTHAQTVQVELRDSEPDVCSGSKAVGMMQKTPRPKRV